jgi:hypothetical protein
MNRRLPLIVGLAVAVAAPLLQPAARADVLDDGFAIVDTTLPGASECSTGAPQPTVANRAVRGTATITCDALQAVLVLTVCVETSPNGAPNSWTEVACAAPSIRRNASSIAGASPEIPCPPEPMYYRTRAVGVALGHDDEVNYFGTAFSGRRLAACPIV